MKKFYLVFGCMLLSLLINAQTLEASHPFNGNMNDASSNGNNGNANGATLTSDCLGNVIITYKMYQFYRKEFIF